MNKLYKEERQNEVSVNEINMLVDTPKTKKNYKTFWGNKDVRSREKRNGIVQMKILQKMLIKFQEKQK